MRLDKDRAIKCGPNIKPRKWRGLPYGELSRAEKVCYFMETYLKVPEGTLVGKPFKLMHWQERFIYDVFDNPHGTREAILSVGRKNGKTVLAAGIVLAYICGPERVPYSSIAAGALSKEQAAIVFKHMSTMVELNPLLAEKVEVSEYRKTITGRKTKVKFTVLAKDGSRTLGRSDLVVLGDEWGAIRGETDDFVNALISGQGAYDGKAIRIIISTQAPSDRSMLSTWIDDAERSQNPHAVVHVYAADEECDLLDEKQWAYANPALGINRSKTDLRDQLQKAQRLPALENSQRNLLLNNRVDVNARWLASGPWNECNLGTVVPEMFHHRRVCMGLDLSSKSDLTSAVIAAVDDDNIVQLLSFNFTPEDTLADRERRDKTPWSAWVRQGDLVAVPGSSISYEYVVGWLAQELQRLNIVVDDIAFDRWRADLFQNECERQGVFTFANWSAVGQGYKDFSPRLENFESLLLEKRVNHGGSPLLTMAAANAIAERDPAANVKINKAKSTAKIDPLIAAVMATYAVTEPQAPDLPDDLSYLVA